MDSRVESAIAHWKPRFTANGVTAPDFEKITATLDRWEDWCSAWSEVGAEHEGLGREALDAGRDRSAGAHLAQAAAYFHFAKFVFVEDLDQMKEAHRSAIRCLNDALPYLSPPGERQEVDFEGSELVGVLRRPEGPGPHPAVVLLSGLDSAKEELRPTEDLFLERGLATFTVDGPGQGEAEYDLPIRPDWEVPGRAIYDHVAAQPDIDETRVGIWGVSLGGYYAPRVVSGVSEYKACIGLAGPYSFGAGWDDLPQLTRDTFQVRSHTNDEGEARRVAESLTMEGRGENIRCPVQLVIGKRDRLIDWKGARRLADEIGSNAELLLLEDGNHGCANVSYKHRYRSADWMTGHLT